MGGNLMLLLRYSLINAILYAIKAFGSVFALLLLDVSDLRAFLIRSFVVKIGGKFGLILVRTLLKLLSLILARLLFFCFKILGIITIIIIKKDKYYKINLFE